MGRPFVKGGPKPPNSGRKPGVANKTTRAFKQATLEVFDKIGGVPAFATWARRNRTAYYQIAARLIPHEVALTADPDAVPFDALEAARRVIFVLREMENAMQPQAEAPAPALLPAPPVYTEVARTTPDPRFATGASSAEPPADPPEEPVPEPGPADLVTDPRTGATMAYRVYQMRNAKSKSPPVLSEAEAIASLRMPGRLTVAEWRKDQRPPSRTPNVITGRARRVR
jgi:hypothetical protein